MHRVNRAGRTRNGVAITLISPEDEENLNIVSLAGPGQCGLYAYMDAGERALWFCH